MGTGLRRFAVLGLAVLAYAAAILPMVYFVGFLANLWVPKSIDRGAPGPVGIAIAVNVALILGFVVVHSLLARGRAKRWWARLGAEEMERTVYSLIAGLHFILLIWAWRPLPRRLWNVEWPPGQLALWTLFWIGWAVVVASVLALGTARLYGLATVWRRFRGRPPQAEELALRGPYRWIRHPIYAGTLLALWATPEMSVGHALLAALFTIYILVGQRFEERELLAAHGERFASYRDNVGSYLPRVRARRRLL